MTENKSNGMAWIGEIKTLEIVENSDRLESAVVVCGEGGIWTGVVQRNTFEVGDHVTVFLQDALIPQDLGLDFMEKMRWRVRMSRFRGAPSECLIVGLFEAVEDYEVGTPVGDILKVEKYEKPISPELSGVAKGAFPSFISKTDEPNFQTAGRIIQEMRSVPCYVSMKYDGSSGTVYRHEGELNVCSRNLNLKRNEDNSFWKTALGWGLDDYGVLPDGFGVQFELYGEGIQKNPLGMKGIHGAVFNLFDIKNHEYVDVNVMRGFCGVFDIPIVEILHTNFSIADLDTEGFRRLAEGEYPNGEQREGIVIRPMEEFRTRSGSRASFKVINLLYKD